MSSITIIGATIVSLFTSRHVVVVVVYCSLFVVCCSLLIYPCSLLVVPYSFFFVGCWLLIVGGLVV